MKIFKIDEENEIILTNGLWVVHKNGVPQNAQPTKLFKYYRLNEFNVDALENGYIHLANPKDFNDPFDCSCNLVKENQVEPTIGQPVPSQNNLRNIGIACFSTVDLNPLMWGHYTGSYQGFALKFKPNFKYLHEPRLKSQKLSRVIYSNNPSIVSKELPFSTEYQLLVKLAHWSYENEWRLITEKLDHTVNRLYYDHSDIEEVLFGYRLLENSAPDLRDRFLNSIKEKLPHAPTFLVGPDHRSFRLLKTPLVRAFQNND